eukprot:TRINITY_DN2478_c0_g1_i3.p1 TRINITY_DN2478_c0_g1~~TRINITY_DN2478_c0_g1_i3.p1  ORF type:complete len:441 (-),score=57.55 TRINITY_DN2478_c0_g1_i3:567-1889(-)
MRGSNQPPPLQPLPFSVPAPWRVCTTPTGHNYYVNPITGVSTWTLPSTLPDAPLLAPVIAPTTPVHWEDVGSTNWQRVRTAGDQVYFYNKETRLSSWTVPEGIDTPAKATEDVFTDQTMTSTSKRKAEELGTTLPVGCTSPKRMRPDTHAINQQRDDETHTLPREQKNDHTETETESSEEHCIKEFKQLLTEKKLTRFSTWDKELPKLCYDPRFKLLPRHSDRRAIFEHYVKNIASEERAAREQQTQKATHLFEDLLMRYASQVTPDMTFSAFKKLTAHESCWETLTQTKDLRAVFSRHIHLLQKKQFHSALNPSQREKQADKAFMEMLQELPDIDHTSLWTNILKRVEQDKRCSEVSDNRRERLFEKYKESLSDDYQKEKRRLRQEAANKERQREVQAKHDRLSREMEEQRALLQGDGARARFNTLLAEKIRHHDVLCF